MTVLTHKLQFNSASSPLLPDGWVDCGAGNSVGVKAADIEGSGISFEITVAAASASAYDPRTNSDHWGIPEAVWDRGWVSSASGFNGVFTGFTPLQPVSVTFFGGITAAERNRLLTINGQSYENENPGGTDPITPGEPTTVIVNANEDGELLCHFGYTNINTSYAGMIISHDDAWSTGPSINPTGTDTVITVGEIHSVAFQNLTSPPVSIAIVHGETVTAQADFILGTITDGAATATFTGTLGDLPYGTSGYSYLVVCDDESEITFDTDSLSPAEGRNYVVAVDPVSDETGILYVWDEGGPVTGDQVGWPVLVDGVTTTIRPNFTFYGETETTFPDSIALDIDYLDSVTSTRYYRSVEVAFGEDGEGTVIGVTARGFTVEGFTVRGFTARGF